MVNLVPEPGRNFVSFDLARIIRVVSRITANLDQLQCNAQRNTILPSEPKDKAVRHRERLAEPEPRPRHLGENKQLLAWHNKMKFPHPLMFGE